VNKAPLDNCSLDSRLEFERIYPKDPTATSRSRDVALLEAITSGPDFEIYCQCMDLIKEQCWRLGDLSDLARRLQLPRTSGHRF